MSRLPAAMKQPISGTSSHLDDRIPQYVLNEAQFRQFVRPV